MTRKLITLTTLTLFVVGATVVTRLQSQEAPAQTLRPSPPQQAPAQIFRPRPPQQAPAYRPPSSKWVNVLGEVKKQGRYKAFSTAKFLDLIAHAKGLAQGADEKRIIIRRPNGNEVKMIEVNFIDVIKGKAEDVKMKNGDTIYVPRVTVRRVGRGD